MADLNRVRQLIARFERLADPRNPLPQDAIDAAADFVKNLKAGLCPLCGKEIDEDAFHDEQSWKEYQQSHICMECQNRTFKE